MPATCPSPLRGSRAQGLGSTAQAKGSLSGRSGILQHHHHELGRGDSGQTPCPACKGASNGWAQTTATAKEQHRQTTGSQAQPRPPCHTIHLVTEGLQ